MRTVPRLLLAIVVAIGLVTITETAAWTETTILYDVTTSSFFYFLRPGLGSTTERIQITDRGPQTDGSPRWVTLSLGQVVIWDEPGGGATDMVLFGNSCGDLSMAPFGTLPRRVQVRDASGGGDFAWLPLGPTGESDPYAFFCLKWSHQSTTAWTEQVSIGTKVYPSPIITWPKPGTTVSGTVWVVLWAEDTSGTPNVFTLSADGKQIGSQTTSSRGPVTIPWPTNGATPVPNGTHTLTGTVRDATGSTGTTSVTVILKN